MNKITLQLKKLGKRKINLVELEISDTIQTLQDLLSVCVETEVKKYNDRKAAPKLMSFLTQSVMQTQASSGKITFGDSENNNRADPEKSKETVLQGFTDGQFVVFVNDHEIKSLDQKITLTDQTSITFLRLSFLTGTYW